MPGTKSSAENSMVPSTLKCVCASGSRNSRNVVVKKVLYSSWPTWTKQVSFRHYVQCTPWAVRITGSALALRQDGLRQVTPRPQSEASLPAPCLMSSPGNIQLHEKTQLPRAWQQMLALSCQGSCSTDAEAQTSSALTSLGLRVHSGLLSFCTRQSQTSRPSLFVTGSTGSAASLPSFFASSSAFACFSFVESSSGTWDDTKVLGQLDQVSSLTLTPSQEGYQGA